jgi:hypothetical protein
MRTLQTPFPARIRLCREFDSPAMAAEVEAMVAGDWTKHFVTQNYQGDWSVIPLRGPSGAEHPVMEAIESIAGFLNSIGIPCRIGKIPASTLLPGVYFERGETVCDPEQLEYPGDLLHEAGHIATAPPSNRTQMTGNLESTPADEMAAIA